VEDKQYGTVGNYAVNMAAVCRTSELPVVESGGLIGNKARGGMTAHHKSGVLNFRVLNFFSCY